MKKNLAFTIIALLSFQQLTIAAGHNPAPVLIHYKYSMGFNYGLSGAFSFDRFHISDVMKTQLTGVNFDAMVSPQFSICANWNFVRSNGFLDRTRIGTTELDGRYYIPQTKNHIYISIGLAYGQRRTWKSGEYTLLNQGNMTGGFGYEFRLSEALKKSKNAERIYIGFNCKFGLPYTALYPKSVTLSGLDWDNPSLASSCLSLKYGFDSGKKKK
jgi:hypothetical protein